MDFIEIIKTAACDAVKAENPTDIIEGTVVSAKPLRIQVSQMQTLEEDFLILSDAVCDRTIEVTVDWDTETASAHSHSINGKKKIKIHNALKKDEKVFMVRKEGGQRFYVLGRLGK